MALFEQEQSISHHKGGMSMRKFLTTLLVCGLVLLCACGKQTQDADKPQDTTPQDTTPQNTITDNYKAAVAAIDSGDYRTAYDLLQNATDEPSKELLSRFVFVPTYDALTTQHETTDDMHFSTELTLDERGNIIKKVSTDKGDVTENTYTYDAHGRIIQEKSSSDNYLRIVTYTYDTAGRLTRKHIATEDTYQGNARLDESTYTYAYDTKGNLIEEKRVSVYSNGSEEITTTYRYNEANQTTLKKTVFASGSWNEETTEYRTDGTLYKVTERNSSSDKVYVDEYDEQERLHKEWVIEADGYTYASRTYHYDTAGRLVQIDRYPAAVNFPGTVTYEYDDKGNLLCETEGTQKTTYTYDEKGNCLTTVCTGTNYDWNKRYTYDKQGRLIEEVTTYAREDSTPYTVALTYDADGNKATETQTGMSSEGFGLTTYNRALTWTLCYYPDGVPEMVQEEIDDALRYNEFL